MMGHRVHPVDGKSFRMNPAVTKPYNADFDGDEMNIFVPQNVMAMMEVAGIANVHSQIISPQTNSPIMGCIMDNVLGAYILSLDDEYINERQIMNMIIKAPNFKGLLPPADKIENGQKYWAGKTLFSMVLEKHKINYFKGGNDVDVKVDNGKLVSGKLTKKIVGPSAGGLIHYINNNVGHEEAAAFINDAQVITNVFLQHRGFSVGYDDIKRSAALRAGNTEILRNTKQKVLDYIETSYTRGKKVSMEDYEQFIFNTLNKSRDDIGSKVMGNIDKSNSFFQMIDSGAKGSMLNISQIMGSVGQQNVQWDNKQGRVPMSINNRALPYYHQYDASPDARGFVEHSYVDGLNMTEFFFHMQAGREGVIDTACKTSDVGYLQRKLVKNMEDIKLSYDMTVRNEGNRVVQFSYGGKNSDPSKQELQRLEIVTKTRDEFRAEYKWDRESVLSTYTCKISKKSLVAEYKQLKKLRKKLQKRELYAEDNVCAAMNIPKIIQTYKQRYRSELGTQVMHPSYVTERIVKLEKLIKLTPNTKFPFNELDEYNLLVSRALIRSNLASKIIIHKHKLTNKIFDKIVSEIEIGFYKGLLDPGTAVGPIAAQSIGEPCTQLSVAYDTEVRVDINGKYKEPKIGALIDEYMTNNPERTIQTHITEDGKASSILPIPSEWNIKVPGLNYETEKVEFRRVTEFSRHPPNGKLIRIRTKSGKTVVATLGHSFVVKRDGKVQTVKGSELVLNDVVPIIIDN